MATVAPRYLLGKNLYSLTCTPQNQDADGVLSTKAVASPYIQANYELRGFIDLFGISVQRSDEIIMPVDCGFVHHEAPLTDVNITIGEILGLRTANFTTILPKIAAIEDIVKIIGSRAPYTAGAYVSGKAEVFTFIGRWMGFDDGVKAFGKNVAGLRFSGIVQFDTAASGTASPYIGPLTYAQGTS